MPKAERNIRVDSVVLRHSDYGEADRLLTLYTREQGKIRAIAKGVRKIQSRKAGHLEPFTRVTLMLARGHDLWIVTQAETINAFQPLREELGMMTQAAYVVELLERFSYEEGQNWQLYDLLVATLGTIEQRKRPIRPGAVLRDAPAGFAGVQTASVRMRRVRKRNQGGRSIFFR